jgi:hypothetical protein
VYHSEFGINAPEEIGNIPSQITNDDHVLPVLLEDIRGRAKELKKRYRDHKWTMQRAAGSRLPRVFNWTAPKGSQTDETKKSGSKNHEQEQS